MNRYETLMLARPDITSDELTNLQEQVEKALGKTGTKVSVFDRWGKYRLAYPVQKNSFGVYILARYEIADEVRTQALSDISTLLKIKWNDHVIRFVTKALDADAPTEYQKPEPVDGGGQERRFDKTLSKIEASLKDKKPAPGVLAPKSEPAAGKPAPGKPAAGESVPGEPAPKEEEPQPTEETKVEEA